MRTPVALLALLTSAVALAVPLQLPHQGRLNDATGSPLTGSHTLTVRIYAEPNGGVALWTDEVPTTLEGGNFAINLGATPSNALDSALFDGSVRYLGLQVDAGAELPTRLPILSVPYALRASHADTAAALSEPIDWSALSGVPTSLSNGDDDTLAALVCTTGQVPTWSGSAWGCASPSPASLDVGVLTGTIEIENLPVGTGSGTVAAGDHTHSFSTLTGQAAMSQLPVGSAPGTVAAGDHGHGIADLSGELPLTRTTGDLPLTRTTGDLPLTRTTGDLPASRLSGSVDVARLPVGTVAGTVAAGNHTHTAAAVGALPVGGGTLTGALTGTDATFTGGVQVGAPSNTTCNSAAAGRLRWSGGELTLCDGTDWRIVRVSARNDGSVASEAATTCRSLHQTHPALGNGVYWINPSGTGAYQAYCNMTAQGGGWTLVSRMTNGCFTDSRSAVGSLSSPTQSACAKLSDAAINTLRTHPDSEGIFWGYHDNTNYQLPSTGRFLKITAGEFNANAYTSNLQQQCSCVPEGPWSGNYNAHSTMAGVYNHSAGAWMCVTTGQNGCTSAHVYTSGLFLYQHALNQAGTFPSNSHGISGGSNGWLYIR